MKKMKVHQQSVPPLIDMLHNMRGKRFGYGFYKGLALALTFVSYAAFHATRKPPSIVKSVLKGDHVGQSAQLVADVSAVDLLSTADGWEPFNGPNGPSLLGQVDLAFLATYAICMFFAGHLGDRMDLRTFLAGGMLGSGLFVTLFGMGYFWDVHYLPFYLVVQVLAGLFQSTGWPSVVSIMAHWYGKGKRGLVMGIWNAHTSVGNILGTVVAARYLAVGWGWSFIVPGVAITLLGFLVYLLLVVEPSDIGLATPYEPVRTDDSKDDDKQKEGESESVSFVEAWNIPGVAQFAFCLFFSKLIAYTFLYWLPYYIKSTQIEGRHLTPKEAGDLSVLFDVGGVAGGILAGHLSDKSGASALVATSFTLASVPFLYMYRVYGHISFSLNIALMMLSGFFVNGPYALITTAVSADLGTHESLNGNAKALATVTAIIDGMGSIGAALGPLMTGYISEIGGFNMVFGMLYTAAIMAGLLLVKLAQKEWQVLSEANKKSRAAAMATGTVHLSTYTKA